MCVEKIMFILIRSEILGVSINEDLSRNLTKEKFRELLILSRRHDLSHIIASALSRANILGDDEVSRAFHQALMKAVYRDAQRDYAINLTNTLLEQAQIPHINLKGSVVRNMYPQSWMRTSCDIDILVHNFDIQLVEKVLCSNKFARYDDSSTHDYNFMSPNKVHIEIHHTLVQDRKIPSSDKILSDVWDTYVIPVANCKYRYDMTPEILLIYHLAHMGRHLLHGGCGVRPFIDLWLLEKHFSAEKSKLDELMIQCNLKALYDASMELSKVWLEGQKHSKVTEQFEQYILCGGTYGTTANAAKIKAATGVGKVRSLFNLIFLPRVNLEVLYPNLKKHPTLYPFYQIKRWFRYFDKSKRNKVKHISKQRNNVTIEETTETATLLNHLGLI